MLLYWCFFLYGLRVVGIVVVGVFIGKFLEYGW